MDIHKLLLVFSPKHNTWSFWSTAILYIFCELDPFTINNAILTASLLWVLENVLPLSVSQRYSFWVNSNFRSWGTLYTSHELDHFNEKPLHYHPHIECKVITAIDMDILPREGHLVVLVNVWILRLVIVQGAVCMTFRIDIRYSQRIL